MPSDLARRSVAARGRSRLEPRPAAALPLYLAALAVALILSVAPARAAQPPTWVGHSVGWIAGTYPSDGYGTILHTVNGGSTWVRQGNASEIPSVTIANIKAVDDHTAYAVGWPSDGYGTILRTTDGGASWARLGTPATIPNMPIEGITVADPATVWIVGGGGMILRSDDAGRSWVAQSSGTTTTLFEIKAVDARTAWAAGDEDDGYAVILHTTDGGKTWVRQGTQQTIVVDALIDLTVVDSRNVWGGGPDQHIVHSTDGGATWRNELPKGLDHVNGMSAVSRAVAWAAVDYNRVERTTDGGATWNPLSVPATLQTFYLLGVKAIGPNVAWVVGGAIRGYSPGVILRTTDAGVTWDVQTPSPNTTYRRVSFVLPAPASVTYRPDGSSTLVQWRASASATGYRVYIGGRLAGSTLSRTWLRVSGVLGPKAKVSVRAFATDASRSELASGAYAPTGHTKIGTVHFATNSANLTAASRRTLWAFARTIAAQGFASVRIEGYTSCNPDGGARGGRVASYRRGGLRRCGVI